MWEFHILYAGNKKMTGWLKAPYPGRYLDSQIWVVEVVARLFFSNLSSSKFGYNNKIYQRRWWELASKPTHHYTNKLFPATSKH